MRKLISLFLILAMVFSITIVASASTENETNSIRFSMMQPAEKGVVKLDKFLYNEKDGIPFGVAFFDMKLERGKTNITNQVVGVSSDEQVMKM